MSTPRPSSTASPQLREGRRKIGISSLLHWLILAAILPVAIFSAVLAAVLVERERDTFRRSVLERSLALLTAIDSELKSSITTLQALATSRTLDELDLASFRERASRILAAQSDWSNINLALPSGQQIVNLKRAEGAPLPLVPDPETVQRVARTGKPAVSNMVLGPVTADMDFGVRVPVVREGQVKFVLSGIVKPASVLRLMQLQDFPADWIGLVMDREGRFVARTLSPEKSVGQTASESMRATLSGPSSGWFPGRTLEGEEFFTAYHRSPVNGWTVAIGIPATTVREGANRAAWILAIGLLAAVAAALALARLVSRRVSGPIAALGQAAEAIGRGSPEEVRSDTRVAEIDALAQTVRTAAAAVREREALLAREKRALLAADRAKDEFIAMLSHELRNPLAALMSASHILERVDPADEQARHARAVIARQTQHMSKLIKDLLDVSRVLMGKADIEWEVFELGQMVSRLVAAWRSTGRIDRQSVQLDISAVWVNADRARVEQILSNLLDNALKFGAPEQSIRIRVREENGEAVLEVADGGEGLAPEMIERVFGLFVQGDDDLARSRGGMGVGLALVRRLAELHGGGASAASAGPGCGATFTVRLPASAAEEEVHAPPPAGTRSRRVLVIEDSDDARRMLAAGLALNGHEVSEARDGTSGLAAAAENRPEVVLLDIGLPDMDGYEVARRLRTQASGSSIVLIALTGYGQKEDARRIHDAGFDAHLVKPVSVDLLEQAIAITG